LWLWLLFILSKEAHVDMHDVVLIIWWKFLSANGALLYKMVLHVAVNQLFGFTCTELHVTYWTSAIAKDVRCIHKPTEYKNCYWSFTRMKPY